jgi:hypothetical protein
MRFAPWMRSLASALSVTAAVAAASGAGQSGTQVTILPPGTAVGKEQYGVIQPAEVSELAAEMYLRRAVRARGFLAPLDFQGRYYTLSDGGAQVVLIPAADYVQGLKSLAGRRVEVEGYVRRLVSDQGTCPVPPDRRRVPQSLCDNPELPPTPNLQGEAETWPRVSITTWYVGDLTSPERRLGESRDLIGDIVGPEAPAGKAVRVVGRFCGAGLCGGLGAAPLPKAWVLHDGVTAVWVIGKDPSGKGWRLDPTYKGDTSRWIEVVGRVEACGTTRCLKAKSVTLVPSPGAADSLSPVP